MLLRGGVGYFVPLPREANRNVLTFLGTDLVCLDASSDPASV